MSLRKCIKCGLEANNDKQLNLFVPRKENKHGRRNVCYPCHQTITNENCRERFRKNKKRAIAYKGGKCNMCGLNAEDAHDAVFDFHHLDPNEKELNIGKVMHHSWAKIEKEIDKCILLCANCHRVIHANKY